MKTAMNFLLIALAILAANVSPAQDDDGPPVPQERMKEIKAQKSAYLTQKMDLSPEEAQQFWPIYNQMDEEEEANRKEFMELRRSLKKSGTEITEQQANDLLDRELAMREKELQIAKKYDPQLRKAIGAQKLVKLYKAERDFHREVMRRFRDRDEGERPRDGQRRSPQAR